MTSYLAPIFSEWFSLTLTDLDVLGIVVLWGID